MAVSKFGLKDWLLGWLVPSGTGTAAIQAVALTSSTGAEYNAASPLPVALQASSASAAFNPTGEAALSVTTTSARVALGSAGPTALVVNTGATVAYVAFGNASVVANTTSGHPVPAGWGIAFDIGSANFIAAITASSTTTLTITTGTGIPALTGGGGGSGGGDVNLAEIGGTATKQTVAGAIDVVINDSAGTPITYNANGQATMANSAPVVIASNQTAVPVAGSGTAGTANAGVVTVQGIASMTALLAQVGTTTLANGQVAPTNTAATLIAARTGRQRVTFYNTGAVTVFIGIATVTTANGMALISGASITLNTSALVQAITAAGTGAVSYIEEF